MPAPRTMSGQTADLRKRYFSGLQNNSISNEELVALLQEGVFQRSEGFVNTGQPTSNAHFNELDGARHFVQVVGPKIIPKETLHALNARMLTLVPKGEKNTYLRNSVGLLAKAMLAYEFARYPEDAEKHFSESSRLMTELGTAGTDKFKTTIRKS